MHKEYAVDPATIASSWTTFLYLTEKFGFEKGRLISDFPSAKWAGQVKMAAGPLADVEKKKVMEKLREKHGLILAKTNRYFSVRPTWLESALFAHGTDPFDAIISDNSSEAHPSILCSEDCQDTHPLMCPLPGPERTPGGLAAASRLLLANSRKIKFVDPYFNLREDRWLDVLKEFLNVVYQRGYTNTHCEYHYGEKDQAQPCVEEFASFSGARLRGTIPHGMTITFVRWKQKFPGERLHARYILTERGGLGFEGGLDRGGTGQTTDVTLLDPASLKKRWEAFDQAATVYELVKPILRVDSAGHVQEVNT